MLMVYKQHGSLQKKTWLLVLVEPVVAYMISFSVTFVIITCKKLWGRKYLQIFA
jgi:hypothetical protein